MSKSNLNQLSLLNLPPGVQLLHGGFTQLPDMNNVNNQAAWLPLNTAAILNQIDPSHATKSPRHSLPSLSASMASPLPTTVALPPLYLPGALLFPYLACPVPFYLNGFFPLPDVY